MRRRKDGFTFIEVIISIALVGLLTASIGPLLQALIVYPLVGQANGELSNLRTAATAYYVSHNATANNTAQLYVGGPTTGNYTIAGDGTIAGVVYPGLIWNGARWTMKR
jgi:prepilin-type N-terminal cleavage/methylation domain-containing protein